MIRDERGYTLIELLIVVVILGILAAIAIPAFVNQKGKANDSTMKVQVRTMQTAMETCASDNTSAAAYTGCDLTRVNQIEPSIPTSGPDVALLGSNAGYRITSAPAANTGNRFQITKATNGTLTRDCGTGGLPTVGSSGHGSGGCPSTGDWSQ